MTSTLLDRLEMVTEKLLEQNRQLSGECRLLRQEKVTWLQERKELLREVERSLTRFESLSLEDS